MKLRLKPIAMLPELIRHLFKKPATVKYPFEKLELPPDHRCKLAIGADRCIGCMLCVRDCPTNCLAVTKVFDSPNAKERKYKIKWEMDRCIFCAQCVEVCPTDAILLSKDFELAQTEKEQLTFEYEPTIPNKPT